MAKKPYEKRYRDWKEPASREGKIEEKIEGKVEILYEELHMTVAEIAEKLVISEEEVQKIVDASK